MEALLDTAPCGFLRHADDGTILLTNHTLRALLGADEDELEWQHLDAVAPPAARIFYQTHVFPLLRLHGRADEIALTLRARDGTDLPVLLNAVRREHEGQPVSDWAVLVMRRRNRLEDELLEAKRRAQEAERTKDRFLAMLSHDLRAPLSGISMAAEVLASGTDGALSEPQRRDLERIQHASQYVLRLVSDILNFARLQAGEVDVRLQPTPLGEAITRAEAVVRPLADAAGLALRWEGCAPELAVRADAVRLQQVLLNLLTNAVKFTDTGGRVTLSCASEGDRVAIEVADTGRGIPAEQLSRIFDPFVQLERSAASAQEGHVGLGLAISRELARSMGGDLTVESAEGRGSTFTLTLNAAPAPDDAAD